MAGNNPVEEETDPRRKILRMVVCSLCYDAGFSTVKNSVVETLTEMLQSTLGEIGRSAQAYCELAGRTSPMLSDVAIALIEMGTKIEQIPVYAKKPNKNVFIPPTHKHIPPVPGILETGERRQHPSYIPDHYPPFPGPHSYIRTPTHRDPIIDYQLVREKAATQKRDIERALTRFIAKTGKTQKLFNDDNGAFPLIAVKPITMAYLNALLPKDQDLDAQLPVENQWANIMQKYSEEHVPPEGAASAGAAAPSSSSSTAAAAAPTAAASSNNVVTTPTSTTTTATTTINTITGTSTPPTTAVTTNTTTSAEATNTTAAITTGATPVVTTPPLTSAAPSASNQQALNTTTPGGLSAGDGGASFLDRYDFTQMSIDSSGDSEVIDNPYLRPVKPPRKKKR